MIVRQIDKIKIDGNKVDFTVPILGIDEVPMPFGISKTITLPDRAIWQASQVNLARVERAWDRFDLELYMEIIRYKNENL